MSARRQSVRSLGNVDRSYKRGAIMGLTVAEAFILLSFILLLLFSWWQVEADKNQNDAREILDAFSEPARQQLVAQGDQIRSAIVSGTLGDALAISGMGLTAKEIVALVDSRDFARLVSEQHMQRLAKGLVELPPETRLELTELVEAGDFGRVLAAANPSVREFVEGFSGAEREEILAERNRLKETLASGQLGAALEIAQLEVPVDEIAKLLDARGDLHLLAESEMRRLAEGLAELSLDMQAELADLVAGGKIGPVLETARNDRIAQATRRLEASAAAQRHLVGALEDRLGRTIREAGGEIDENGTISLPQAILFDVNDDRIKAPEFLAGFCAPWLDTLRRSGLNLSELKIEGHASSEGPSGATPEAAYLYNLDLSQRRAQNALRVCLTAERNTDAQRWAREHLSAVGYSSARFVMNAAGQEDRDRSRRVMFSVGIDHRKLIDDIERDLGALVQNGVPITTDGTVVERASASTTMGAARTNAVPEVVLVGSPRIVDGDGLEIDGARIRLFGIDAPELQQTCGSVGSQFYRCGEAAAEKLKEIIAGHLVECQSDERDIYGRYLATCTANGRDIAEELVIAGFAMPFLRYSDRYNEQARQARAQASGLWSSEFQPPWEFRSERRPKK